VTSGIWELIVGCVQNKLFFTRLKPFDHQKSLLMHSCGNYLDEVIGLAFVLNWLLFLKNNS
jgi:hypothetical protein